MRFNIVTVSGPLIIDWAPGQRIIPVGEPDALKWWDMSLVGGLHDAFGHRFELTHGPVGETDLFIALSAKVQHGYFEAVRVDGELPPIVYPEEFDEPGVCT